MEALRKMIIKNLESWQSGWALKECGSWWGLTVPGDEPVVFLLIQKTDWEKFIDRALSLPERRVRQVVTACRLPATDKGVPLPPESDWTTVGQSHKAEIVLDVWKEWFRLTISIRDPKQAARVIHFFHRQSWFVRLVLWAVDLRAIPAADPNRSVFMIMPPEYEPEVSAVESATGFFCVSDRVNKGLIEEDYKEILWRRVVGIFGYTGQMGELATAGPRFRIDQASWDEINRVCEEGMVCEGGMTDLP